MTDDQMMTLTLGDARVTLVRDGELDVPGDRLYQGFPAEIWRGRLPDAGDGLVTVTVTVAIVQVDGEIILLDTGLGEARTTQRRGGALGPALARLGLTPAAVTRVVISHAHGDHIWGAVTAAGVPAFPAARYHLPRADWAWLQRFPDNPGNAVLTPIERAGLLTRDDGDAVLTPSLRSLDTAGHAPGHRCLLLTAGGRSFCFLGDLVHDPELHFAQPDCVTAFDYKPTLTPAARRRVASAAVAGNWLLCAAHGIFPPLGGLAATEAEGWTWQAVAGL
ncbi:MAG: MBL fold metallo-hydrolase [Chloroflexi bacterium]|nr:MBL fold metallo-hydrolase [Chloroflexota bacterium]